MGVTEMLLLIRLRNGLVERFLTPLTTHWVTKHGILVGFMATFDTLCKRHFTVEQFAKFLVSIWLATFANFGNSFVSMKIYQIDIVCLQNSKKSLHSESFSLT
jgi:hypothetical protein